MITQFLKKAYHEHKQDIPNTFWMLVFGTGKQGFTIGVFLIAAVLLSPYDFGLYSYVTSILLLLVLFGDFGISNATSKLVAELKALDHHDQRKSVLYNSTILALFFITLTVIGVLIFEHYSLSEHKEYLLYLIPSLVLLPLAYLYAGIYRGTGRFKQAAIIIFFSALSGLIIAYILMKMYGLIGAIWSNNIFSFIFFISMALGHNEDWSRVFNSKIIRNITTYSLVLGFTSLSHYLYSRVDVILLGRYNYITEIGFYELINKTFLFLLTPSMLIAHALAPTIAGLSARKRYAEIKHKYTQVILISIGISLIVLVLAYFGGPMVVSYYFPQYAGDVLRHGMHVMLIMLVGQAAAAIAASGFSVPTGHAKLNMKFLFTFGVINLPLTYIFIAKWGFTGAIYSTVIIRSLTDILFVSAYYFVIKKEVEVAGDVLAVESAGK
jgi:O-antigen/teichoic acid export membrane protein